MNQIWENNIVSSFEATANGNCMFMVAEHMGDASHLIQYAEHIYIFNYYTSFYNIVVGYFCAVHQHISGNWIWVRLKR